MTPEGKVKAAVRKLLEERGAYQFWPVVGVYGKKGVDVFACYGGRFLAIECKRPKGETTDLQDLTLKDVNCAGGYPVLEDSEGCKELLRILDHIDALMVKRAIYVAD